MFYYGSLTAGNDGGLFVGNAFSPASWSGNFNYGLGLTQFQAIGLPVSGTGVMTGGTQDNGTDLYSGQLAWQQSDLGDGGYALIDPKDPTVFFGSRFSDKTVLQVRRSQRSGAPGSYAAIAPPPGDPVSFFLPMADDPTAGNRLLIGTDRVYESCVVAVNPITHNKGLVCNAASGSPTGNSPALEMNASATPPNNRMLVNAAPTSTPTPKVQWTRISNDLTAGCTSSCCDISDLAIAPSNPAVTYAVTSSDGSIGPKAWVSKNATCTNPPCVWTDITAKLTMAGLPAKLPLTSVAVSPISPAIVMITASGFTGSGKHVFLSQDYGAHFNDISAMLPDIPVLTGIFDSCNVDGILVGTDIGVFHSSDLGAHWVNFSLNNSLPNVPVYQLRQNKSAVVAATHGRGVWTLSGCP